MPTEVCIIRNPQVTIDAAIPSLQSAFQRRGIKATVVDDVGACSSEYRLSLSLIHISRFSAASCTPNRLVVPVNDESSTSIALFSVSACVAPSKTAATLLDPENFVQMCIRDSADAVQIGRVLTTVHGKGLGTKILQAGIAAILGFFTDVRTIRLEAQCYATGFYTREGFAVQGEPFDEDGIPHVLMERPLVLS